MQRGSSHRSKTSPHAEKTFSSWPRRLARFFGLISTGVNWSLDGGMISAYQVHRPGDRPLISQSQPCAALAG
jgi:hypothetical protein